MKHKDAQGATEIASTSEEMIKANKKEQRNRALAKSILIKVAVIIIGLYVLLGVLFGLAPMKGGDMQPSLMKGDLLVYQRIGNVWSREITVMIDRDGSRYTGRIIGLPGETINIDGSGSVIVDGNILYEEDIYYRTRAYPNTVEYPIRLKDDEYFILADKRDTAKDSRYFGPVRESEFKGKVINVIRRMP